MLGNPLFGISVRIEVAMVASDVQGLRIEMVSSFWGKAFDDRVEPENMNRDVVLLAKLDNRLSSEPDVASVQGDLQLVAPGGITLFIQIFPDRVKIGFDLRSRPS